MNCSEGPDYKDPQEAFMKFVEFTSAESGDKVLINLDNVTDILPKKEGGTTFQFSQIKDHNRLVPKIDIAENYKVVFAMINERQAYLA